MKNQLKKIILIMLIIIVVISCGTNEKTNNVNGPIISNSKVQEQEKNYKELDVQIKEQEKTSKELSSKIKEQEKSHEELNLQIKEQEKNQEKLDIKIMEKQKTKEQLNKDVKNQEKKHDRSSTEVIDNFINLPQIKNSSVGIKAVNLDTNKVLVEKSSNESLVPASNFKLLTTGIALDKLGANYRFKTTITYDGVIDSNGTLDGNIYIIGGGDPTLGSKYLVAKDPEYMTGEEKNKQLQFLDVWADKIKELGIKKINGNIVADSSYIPKTSLPSTWEWGDLRYHFASYPSGLTFMDNNIVLTLKNNNGKVDTIISPSYSKTTVTNKVKSNHHGSDITIVVVPYSDEIIVLGTLREGQASYTTVMQDPASTLAIKFSDILKSNGIENNGGKLLEGNGGKKQDMKNIYVNYSPKLEEIIGYTNKFSVNLFAEHLKLQVEKTTGKTMKNLWKERIPVNGLYVYDGSGLSRYDGVNPDIIVDVLKSMKESKNFEIYYNSLAQPRKPGTFRNFKNGTVLVDNYHGKSGTLTGVKSYGGYMNNKDGDLIGFSIIVNHHSMRDGAISGELQKIMESFYYLD